MKLGYARTSTLDQVAGLEAQIDYLWAAGCELVFEEQISSIAKRPELERALDRLQADDTLVVTKLDRLARSTNDLIEISDRIARKGAGLRILDLAIDTTSAVGKLMLTIVGAISCWEREIMLERQREGIRKARAEGRYRGRKPTARAKSPEVKALDAAGIGATEITRRLGISRASVYRILAEAA